VERVRAYLISLVVLGAVALPAFRHPFDDAFPLSTYPMFSRSRGTDNVVASAVAIVVDTAGAADSREVRVPPRYVANMETMLAFRTLARAVRSGPAAAQALCGRIAERLSRSGDGEFAGAERVELITERVDALEYLSGQVTPKERSVRARCRIRQLAEARVR